MKTPQSVLPDLPTLTKRLTAGLHNVAGNGTEVKVLKRTRPHFMSTFPNEIVTCQWPAGRKRRVFIKYGANRNHAAWGHRGDLAYEAEVYQRVLRPLLEFRPRCLGAHTNSATGDTALFLEYADRCAPLSEVSWNRRTCKLRPMLQTTRWLAQFHAQQERRVADPALAFLKRYDAAYYRGWARRTLEFARPLQSRFSWLPVLAASGDAWLAPLLSATPAVIHGEFDPKTVLVRNGTLFLLDWESAAIAPGEIDLAMLTDGAGWPAHLVRRCEDQYQRARWPGGAPAGFKRTLAAARIYVQFRWLGDRPEKTLREKTFWRYDHLRAAVKELGVI
jgi:hypothetical protein